MPLIRSLDPVLDGAAVDLGSAGVRSVVIPVGAYATPFWIRDGGSVVHRVDSLPWKGTLVGAGIEALSGDPSVSELGITTTSLPAATEDEAYSQTVAANGGQTPYVWSIVAGSLGDLDIDEDTGAITGTPLSDTDLSFTVRVTDANLDAADQELTITVNAASGVSPTYSIDFDSYADKAAMLADPQITDVSGAGNVDLVDDGGEKVLRCNFPYTGAGETTAGVDIVPTGIDTLQPTEVWVEFEAKFSANWATDDGPGAGNPDHKFFFILPQTPAPLNRIENMLGVFGSSLGLYVGGNGQNYGSPEFVVGDVWDNAWHTYRYHWRKGTNPKTGGTGRWIIDIDTGLYRFEWPGTASGRDMTTGDFVGQYARTFALSRNLNKGTEETKGLQWVEYRRPRIWAASDPGWGF